MLSIAILALPNCMYSSITGPFDVFSVANIEWGKLSQDRKKSFADTKIITLDGTTVTSFNGVPITPFIGSTVQERFDIILIPVLFGDLEPVLGQHNLIAWLRTQHEKGSCICSVCAGSFLIAETGLLDGRQATTHWQLANEFQLRYPRVNLKPEKMLVDDGEFISAGGVTAYLDLSIYLVARFGSPELASSLSKILLIDSARQTQTPYRLYHFQKSHEDKEIRKVQEWLELHYKDVVKLSHMANAGGMGERTFSRRFKKATGDKPFEYLQMMRIESARKILESTNETIDNITFQIGYEDVSSFRRLFKKHTGLSPSLYRKKFSSF
jgi:transcriptional regulator GlxA family with amidase domain